MTHLQSTKSLSMSDTRLHVLNLALTVGESSVEKPSCDLLCHGNALFPLWNKEMAACECGVTHDVKQMQQMIPFITFEIAFR